ncbi:MAG TPA: CmpA/NrtA family ABC transporter substrate-binding protein [Gammaproteobacteria bacterium]|nr:CmpA/NrtA family ABC transporter substrate-binding protein [Gammaproteobacteria bacterium]
MAERIAAAFVPLVDCAVLVVAREQGFAEAEGFELELVREPSWASLRDHLNLGYVDCAHALAPLPVASTLGVGHVQVDCFVPFVLSRGGNAVTVSTTLHDEMQDAAGERGIATPAAAAEALAAAVRRRASPPTLGMVFPFSNHNFDLRYWLAAAGVHPDRDVRLVAIPPPLMVDSLRAGHVDGFCVGEPWNSLAVAEGIGRIVATNAQLVPRGAEKVLAVRASVEYQPRRLGALLRALAAAAQWADDPGNHGALAALLARQEYVGAPAELIELVLRGRLALGDGRAASHPDFMYFHRHGANLPRAEEALWAYAQMVRWGQVRAHATLQRLAARVFREDLYRRYVGGAAPPEAVPAAFDGVRFTPGAIDEYVGRFAVSTRFVEPPARDF